MILDLLKLVQAASSHDAAKQGVCCRPLFIHWNCGRQVADDCTSIAATRSILGSTAQIPGCCCTPVPYNFSNGKCRNGCEIRQANLDFALTQR